MNFKKILESKHAQGAIEYLGVAMVIAAAVVAVSLLPRITNSFRDSVDTVMRDEFGAEVIEEDPVTPDPGTPGSPGDGASTPGDDTPDWHWPWHRTDHDDSDDGNKGVFSSPFRRD